VGDVNGMEKCWRYLSGFRTLTDVLDYLKPAASTKTMRACAPLDDKPRSNCGCHKAVCRCNSSMGSPSAMASLIYHVWGPTLAGHRGLGLLVVVKCRRRTEVSKDGESSLECLP